MNNEKPTTKKYKFIDYFFKVMEKLPETTRKIVAVVLASLLIAIVILINYIIVIGFNVSLEESFTNLENAAGLFVREICFLILLFFVTTICTGIYITIIDTISDVKKAIHEVKIEKEREKEQ